MSSQQTFTYSKSILEILEKGVKYVQWCRSDAFIVNFENIANLSSVSIADFEQGNIWWVSFIAFLQDVREDVADMVEPDFFSWPARLSNLRMQITFSLSESLLG